ncbi:uncharacterized protein comr [Drosophila bipectinata]|uniref:uncharacterized protein comr n=1 Tax=Drosophila bipectinata TaxID=42026 RepID=UPI001C8A8218|nr:uncharacterized protein LOC108124974 [Drosophila bipectinata]
MSRPRANRSGQQMRRIPFDEEFLGIEEAPRTEEEQLVEMLVEPGRTSPTDHLNLLEFLDTLEVPQELAISECDGDMQDSTTCEAEEDKWPTPPPRNHTAVSSTNSKQNQEDVENHRRIFRQLGRKVPEAPTQHPILDYPFVMKLFLAAGSEAFPFLKWTESGRELQVDYVDLQDNLASGMSMFRSRSVVEFTTQLMELGFERLWSMTSEDPERGRIHLFFQHPKFSKGQLVELKSLVEDTGQDQVEETPGQYRERERDQQRARIRAWDLHKQEDEEELQLPPLHQAPLSHLDRMSKRGDLCSSIHNFRAPLQIVRSRFQTLLAYQVDLQVLKDHKDNATSPKGKKARNISNNQTTEQTPAPQDITSKFVKPQESVITIGIGQAPDYAGYYGSVDLSKVNEFFSEYLPRYGAKITGYKEIVMDATNKSNGFQQNLPIGMDYSDEDDDALPPIASCSMEVDIDSQPSTSAAAKSKATSRKPVNDVDLELAMQELCDGPNPTQAVKNQTAGPTNSKAKPKPRGRPKPKKRLEKLLQSSSSENDDDKELHPLTPTKEAPEVVPSRTIMKEKIELVDEENGGVTYIMEIEVPDVGQMAQENEHNPDHLIEELHEIGSDFDEAEVVEKEVEEEEVAEEEVAEEEVAEEEVAEDEVAEEEVAEEEVAEEEVAEEEVAEEEVAEEEVVDEEVEADEEDVVEEVEEESEEEDEEEDEVEEDDDDDYIAKNVQYRTDPPAKRRRYDLRNSKRSSM